MRGRRTYRAVLAVVILTLGGLLGGCTGTQKSVSDLAARATALEMAIRQLQASTAALQAEVKQIRATPAPGGISTAPTGSSPDRLNERVAALESWIAQGGAGLSTPQTGSSSNRLNERVAALASRLAQGEASLTGPQTASDSNALDERVAALESQLAQLRSEFDEVASFFKAMQQQFPQGGAPGRGFPPSGTAPQSP